MPLVISDQAPFLNELILANQRTKFNMFLIIVDSRESRELHLHCSVLIEIERKT